MSHPLINVIDFEIVGPYTLRIIFDNKQERTIDFEPVLRGYYYGPLRDLKLFEQVRLDPEVHTLVWPNDADFDPATLYNWHQGEGEELAKRASNWQKSSIKDTKSSQSSFTKGVKPANKTPIKNNKAI